MPPLQENSRGPRTTYVYQSICRLQYAIHRFHQTPLCQTHTRVFIVVKNPQSPFVTGIRNVLTGTDTSCKDILGRLCQVANIPGWCWKRIIKKEAFTCGRSLKYLWFRFCYIIIRITSVFITLCFESISCILLSFHYVIFSPSSKAFIMHCVSLSEFK